MFFIYYQNNHEYNKYVFKILKNDKVIKILIHNFTIIINMIHFIYLSKNIYKYYKNYLFKQIYLKNI